MADRNFKVKNGLTIGENIAIDDDGTITGLDTDNLDEGSTNLYYTEARVDANFDTKTTDALDEGSTNLYYTEARVDANFATKTTDDLDEGTTNQYFTNARARQAITVSDTGGDGSLSYDNSTGVITYTGPSATEVRAHFSGGTGVTITDGVVAIGQSVGTGDSPAFAGVSAGNISVGVATDNTITSTNTNGNLVLAANGTGDIVLSTMTRLQGEIQASTNLNYVFPAQTLNTVTDNNGYSAVSSMPAGTNGYGANAGFTHYYGDTLAGNNTTGAFNFRTANGNSSTDTVPFTGIAGVAPSASSSGNALGTLNYNGYGTTGFINDIGTASQGGGINAVHNLQFQGYAAEAFSNSTLTLTSANVTAVASSFRATLGSPSVTGTRGQISFNSTTPGVGNAVRVTGTLTGTATGIVSGQVYYIIVTNGSTTATLSATPGGSPITTTAGTLTGLSLIRCGVTFTTTGLTSVPFGRGALVTVSGVTNVTDGTYPVAGTPTTTSFLLGIPHTVAPTVSGSQSFSCSTTYGMGGLRIRAYPAGVPMNQQNRLEVLDMTPASTTIRSDALTLNKGSYGNTGTGLPSGNISYRRTWGCFHKMANVTAAAANTAYSFDWYTSTTAHVGTQGVTVASANPTRIVVDSAGNYEAVIEMMVKNTDNAERKAWIWLAKNGTDLADTRIKASIRPASAGVDTYQVITKMWAVDNLAANDYLEVRFAVDNTSGISLEYEAAQTTPFVMPAQASATITILPVGA
jgi:hypothetical protein